MQKFLGHIQQIIKCYMLITLGRTLFIEGGYNNPLQYSTPSNIQPTPVFLLGESYAEKPGRLQSQRVTKSQTWLSEYHT